MLEYMKANWRKYAFWIFLCAVAVAANHFFNANIPLPLPPQEFKTGDDSYNAGWTEDPAAVQAVAATLKFAVFADTPAGQVADALPDHFYQFEVYRKCDPRGPPAKAQGNVGSCVSFGVNNAILRTMACQIVMLGAAEELADIAEEVTYAGSRIDIGKGRLGIDNTGGNNPHAGSNGGWAAQYVREQGIVARAVHGSVDLTKYDATRCRLWGNTGAPTEIKTAAKLHPVKDITQIKSWADCKRALSQGYGVAVCSNQGFVMQRDSRGVCRPSGSWGHCMCIDGYHVEGGKEFAHIENSWGANAMTGPTGWGNPSGAGFWCDAAVAAKMIGAGDTWAFSGVKGFPARDSEWFVKFQPAGRNDSRLASLTKGFYPCENLYSLSP